ncbi:Hypothetical protein MCYN_0805 [Mycoplasmopsis cynos C142]|uniref:Lipoprotein n=1 Tax=Mycoplasmopsis cynos (strain C142) TaxID=1246955 RepID=L0RWP3_MYCC1|nr:Hypothetical protein MCYN_0805 [Mycoplasmopsis cynos C142]
MVKVNSFRFTPFKICLLAASNSFFGCLLCDRITAIEIPETTAVPKLSTQNIANLFFIIISLNGFVNVYN